MLLVLRLPAVPGRVERDAAPDDGLNARDAPAARKHDAVRPISRKQTILIGNICVWTLFFWSYLLLAFSEIATGKLSSNDQRWAADIFSPDQLAPNDASLQIPRGKTWADMTLAYELRAGEAINIVLGRTADDFQVIRLSRLPIQTSGYLRFRGGEVVEKRPFLAGVAAGAAGEVRFLRVGYDVRIMLDGVDAIRFRLTRETSAIGLNMYPPTSTHLYDRVRVRQVLLSGNEKLAPSVFGRVFRSKLFFFVFAMSSAAALLIARTPANRQSNTLGRRWSTGSAFLIGFAVTAMAAGAVFGWTKDRYGFGISRPESRMIWLEFVTVLHLSAVAIWQTIRAASRNGFFPFKPHRTKATRISSFAGKFLFGLIVVWGFVIGFLSVVRTGKEPRPLGAWASQAKPRIACYGGSTTYGFPFGPAWGFPQYLQTRLRERGRPEAAVWNLGIEAMDIRGIEKRIAADAYRFQPTVVIINSLVNNRFSNPADVEGSYENILRFFAARRTRVFVIGEPSIADLDPEHEKSGLFRRIRAATERENGTFIDPSSAFAEHRDEFLFVDLYHLTKFGNHLMADVVAKTILTEGLL